MYDNDFKENIDTYEFVRIFRRAVLVLIIAGILLRVAVSLFNIALIFFPSYQPGISLNITGMAWMVFAVVFLYVSSPMNFIARPEKRHWLLP